jgi:hypothetical protein
MRKSIDSLIDILKLGRRIPYKGDVDACEIGLIVEGSGYVGVGKMIPKLNNSQLAYLDKKMRQLDLHWPYEKSVQQEAKNYVAMCVRIMPTPEYRKWWSNPYHWFGPDMNYWLNGQEWLTQVARETSFAMCNKQKYVDETYKMLNDLAKEQAGPYKPDSKIPIPYGSWVEDTMDQVIEVSKLYSDNLTYLQLIKTAIALERYKKQHTKYPASLESLVPIYMSELPVDPFNLNDSLVYELDKKSRKFELYSKGPKTEDYQWTPPEIRLSRIISYPHTVTMEKIMP